MDKDALQTATRPLRKTNTEVIPLLDEDVICGFSTTASKEVKSSFEILSHLSAFGSISFTKDSVEITCKDDRSIAATTIDTNCCDIEKYVYKVGEPVLTIGISLQMVFQCMTIAQQTDSMCLYLSKESLKKNCLIIEIHSREGTYVHAHCVKMKPSTIQPEIKMTSLMQKKFDVCIKMSTTEFLRTLRAANKNGDSIQILTKYDDKLMNNYCYFATKGKRLGCDFYSKHYFQSTKNEQIECNTMNLYSIPMLLIVAKATNLSATIHIYINKVKDVIGVKYRVSTIGTFRAFIVPLKYEGKFNALTKTQAN